MRKYFLMALSSLMLGYMFFMVTPAVAQGDPVSMLQSVADQMIASLKANRVTIKTNPGKVYSLAYQIVVPRADLDEMSMRVLSPSVWKSATPAQRSAFKKEFTLTLVRTYASALAQYTDQTVKFFPVRGGASGQGVRVNSQIIRSDGPAINVSYRVINRGSGWKLFDMTVEGVSLLESFRSQFADKLSRGDMNSLIADLRAHNGRR